MNTINDYAFLARRLARAGASGFDAAVLVVDQHAATVLIDPQGRGLQQFATASVQGADALDAVLREQLATWTGAVDAQAPRYCIQLLDEAEQDRPAFLFVTTLIDAAAASPGHGLRWVPASELTDLNPDLQAYLDYALDPASANRVRKLPHDLHLSADADELLGNLRAREIDLLAAVDAHVERTDEACVLVTGSICEGLGSASSDIDALVLLRDRKNRRKIAKMLELTAGKTRDVVFYRNGIEINIELTARDDLNDLIMDLVTVGDSVYNPDGLPALPNLEVWKRQFMHRLRTGWVLRNPEEVAMWRDEFFVEILPLYQSVFCYFSSVEMYEDAWANRRQTPESTTYIARSCAEWALNALAARHGFTGQSRKWLIHWLDRIDDAQAQPGIALGKRILFAPSPTDRAGVERLLADLKQLIQFTRQRVSLDSVGSQALDMLEDKLSYTV